MQTSLSRRDLLRTGALAAVSMAFPSLARAADVKKIPIGLELYSVRNELPNDFTGTIEAINGTLTIGGSLSNPSGGLLTAGQGAKILITGGMATNGGTIDLSGGTFDNNNHALSSTGEISGWGIFRTSALSNSGSVTFAAGTSSINGPVTNSSSGTIIVEDGSALFSGLVTNNGTFRVINGGTAIFAGGFSGAALHNEDIAAVFRCIKGTHRLKHHVKRHPYPRRRARIDVHQFPM